MTAPAADDAWQPLTREQWTAMRAEAVDRVPDLFAGQGLPAVLLPYQAKMVETVIGNEVTVIEKSRRIGATWGLAAYAALLAGSSRQAGGMDVLYISYSFDMTKEFVDAVAMFARAFIRVAVSVGEMLFEDQDERGETRQIKATRIQFASGYELIALSSAPRSLRGKQGLVILDEAAFVDALDQVLKAALAYLIWGGKVVVVSTHDGAENTFATLCEDVRKGRANYALIRITFDEAVMAGLYRRVCLIKGNAWTPDGEAEWRQKIRDLYRDGAAEELDVIPRAGGGKYIPRHIVEANADADIPVLRWRCDDRFVLQGEIQRKAAAMAWVVETVGPHLSRLDPTLRSAFGWDFARSGDLTVFWPVQIGAGLARRPPFVVELRNVPFSEQRTILWWILDRLPRLGSGAMDARGNGQQIAEDTAQRYGQRIVQVMATAAWYAGAWPLLKRRLEDFAFAVPADDAVIGDFAAVELVRGVPAVVERRVQAKGEDKDKSGGGQRHGDAAVAALLAEVAAATPAAEYGYEAVGAGAGRGSTLRPETSGGRFGAWAGDRLGLGRGGY